MNFKDGYDGWRDWATQLRDELMRAERWMEIHIHCNTCGAGMGEKCMTSSGQVVRDVHAYRRDAVLEITQPR